MNVEIGTEAPIFLFWEYLFRYFGILSLQCKGHKQEKAQSQQRKRHQQQDLCGKAIKEAGNEARNTAVNVQ
jgi:hypothetical protein